VSVQGPPACRFMRYCEVSRSRPSSGVRGRDSSGIFEWPDRESAAAVNGEDGVLAA